VLKDQLSQGPENTGLVQQGRNLAQDRARIRLTQSPGTRTTRIARHAGITRITRIARHAGIAGNADR
jgi:hypothetical protein